MYEWLIKAGLRYRICVSQTPTPQYELVPAQQTEDGRSGGQVRSAIVERASCFINERYADPLSNLAIARHVGCSVSYLARAFRQQHGVTPCQQLRQVRARAGVELLEGSDLKMDVISRRVGFRGTANFYAAVRSLTGKTPGDVRASRRVSGRNGDLPSPRPRRDGGGDDVLGGRLGGWR